MLEGFAILFRGALKRLYANSYDCPSCRDHCIEIEEKERLLILETYTIVHPGAMVVHFEDAATACATVVRTRRLDTVAFLAFLCNLSP